MTAHTAANAATAAEATTLAKAVAVAPATEAEAAEPAAAAEANAAKAAAKTLNETTATEAKIPNSNNKPGTSQQTRTVPPSLTVVGTMDPGAGTTKRKRQAPPFRHKGSGDLTYDEDKQQYIVDWELTYEDALPEVAALSSRKSFMDQYPKDEAKSKKTKKINTGKGKKVNPKNKK